MLPLDDKISTAEKHARINRLFDALQWISPLVDDGSSFGASEPPAEYLRDGMLAYADGNNWNPGWGEGVYRYDLESTHWEPIGPRPGNKSYHMRSQVGSSGDYFGCGYYLAPAADANLTQASTTVTLGSANGSYAAHTFIVFGAASGSGGSGSDRAIKLTVTGTRIQDDGTRTASHTEIITSDAESLTLNDYLEQAKFIGQVTFTLSAVGADPYTSFSMDFNYGWCKYDDLINSRFHISSIECVGLANANDANFDIQLIHHKSTGWTYHATAFVPGPAAIYSLQEDHNTEYQLISNDNFAWKRTIDQEVRGDLSEGFLVKVVTSANNAVEYLDIHIGYH